MDTLALARQRPGRRRAIQLSRARPGGGPPGRHRHPLAAGPLWRPCGYFR